MIESYTACKGNVFVKRGGSGDGTRKGRKSAGREAISKATNYIERGNMGKMAQAGKKRGNR